MGSVIGWKIEVGPCKGGKNVPGVQIHKLIIVDHSSHLPQPEVANAAVLRQGLDSLRDVYRWSEGRCKMRWSLCVA